ncbi:hypothetical protein [Nocardioides sp.]|uniref:hypothetical protein n=1 Tax=Nocardioides sp. TaxID=35761 RepID=UPI002CA02184|nr:hypothetical protein [Nocardioides sp.]HXH78831.1 hypothetical protein [Nocardioides sp.]
MSNPDPDLAWLRTALAGLRADAEEIRSTAAQIGDSARDQLEQSRQERDQALAELARAGRDGELGESGRRLARRVEHGETTWLDVLHERDPSPEAAALRRSTATAVGSLVEELAEQDPEVRHMTGRGGGSASGS